MFNKKKTWFKKSGNPLKNWLFIGGVASVINTKEVLATYLVNYSDNLAYDSANILEFEVIGNDIQCKMYADYSVKISAFNNSTLVTYYRDYGRCIAVLSNAFLSSTVLNDVYFEKCIAFGTTAFYRSDVLTLVEAPELIEYSGTLGFKLCDEISVIYLPKLQVLGSTVGNDNMFQYLNNLTLITVSSYLETNNSGSPDGDLQYASGKCPIVYI